MFNDYIASVRNGYLKRIGSHFLYISLENK